ncbi:MAG: HD domain-containing protein [Chloroflexi bacterium]|nr:HD domain-containing protein [Chloroflexota bacterium]
MTGLSTKLEALAERYFRRYAYPDWLREHSRLVGRIATLLAEEHRGAVDVRAVGLAGHLHDIGRSPLLEGDPREHNELSALVLAAEGLGECAELARRHPVYAVLDEATVPRTLPERIVYYADRRGGMEILPLEERITETAVRHPRYAEGIERSRPYAREIERELFEGMSLRPEDLARAMAARWR